MNAGFAWFARFYVCSPLKSLLINAALDSMFDDLRADILNSMFNPLLDFVFNAGFLVGCPA
jgi:small basic protein